MCWGSGSDFKGGFKMKFSRIVPKKLTVRYALALITIAGLLVVEQLVIQGALERQHDSELKLRLVESQRSVAEKLSRSALLVQLAGSYPVVQQQMEPLHSAFSEFEKNHPTLLQISGELGSRALSGELDAVFMHVRAFEATLANIVKVGEANGASHSYEIRTLGQGLFKDLSEYRRLGDTLGSEYEKHIRSQIRDVRRLGLILFFLILGVLLLEGLYVMRPAVQRLYSALELRSEFIGRMSHEIRNPMNSILGMSEVLLETPMTAQQQRYVGALRRSGTVLLDMVNRLLDFTAYESGKFTLEHIEFDLYEVIERCVDIMALSAHEKGLALLMDIDPDAPIRVMGDPLRLQQVLVNFISNAIKFTDKGEVKLQLQPESDLGGQFIRLSVADTGIGIRPENIEKIFESFVQEDASIKRRYGGTGLGLTIARDLIHVMGGILNVQSKLQVGSTFWISLPTNMPVKSQELFRDRFAAYDLGGLRVMLVGMSPTKTEIARRLLESQKALIVTSEPSMVLVDCEGAHIPELPPRSENSPVRTIALLDATAKPEFIRSVTRGGIREFLFQPVKPVELMKAIVQAPAERTERPPPAGVRPGLRVLVADDTPENRELLGVILAPLGCSITYTSDGHEALEAFVRGHFDLVLMDVRMPRMDGTSALAGIRAFEKEHGREETPVIAVTANDEPSEGFNAVVAKPIEQALLLETVARLASAQPSLPSSPPSTADPYSMGSEIAAFAPRYLQNRRSEMIRLKTALEQSDFTEIAVVGHRLKGNARSFGFVELEDIGKKLERFAENKNLPALQETVQKMQDFLEKH